MKKTVITFSNRYIFDADGTRSHRRIYEEAFGPIPEAWQVHHINAIKDDNATENLIALPKNFHYWLHRNQSIYLSLVRQGLITKAFLTALLTEYQDKQFNLRKTFLNTLLDRGFLRLGEKDAG